MIFVLSLIDDVLIADQSKVNVLYFEVIDVNANIVVYVFDY